MFIFLKRSAAVRAVTLAAFLHPAATLAQPLTFTIFAGPQGDAGSDDGTGSAARFGSPRGIATDSSGNLYVTDSVNNTVRKITPAGAVTTLAGLAGSPGSSDGTGSAARFNVPEGVATDSSGNVYVTDQGNHTIRKITPAGAVTTLAGMVGVPGNADGTGSSAQFRFPAGVATDAGGNVYIADLNNSTIRKITPAGVVTTLAGLAGNVGSADGTMTNARFNFPAGVATDSSGNVYVADSNSQTIRAITPAGVVTTLAGLAGTPGNADGTGSAARFAFPRRVATDSSGNVFVADQNNSTIRKISPAGVVTTLAGLAGTPGDADGTGSAARFASPSGVATDISGNVYVADAFNLTIRKITPAGTVTTLAGLAFGSSGSTDGLANAARFFSPSGVATDTSGNVYVADTSNHTIRKITPAGAVSTLAGLAGSPGTADGQGSAARFFRPLGVATDSSGNVYVGDEAHTIRKITPAGAVTTLAGLASAQGSADGTGSAARFTLPGGVATDSSGNVYVATANDTIRKITPTGVVTTLAGLAGNRGTADGTGSAARFAFPRGVATDSSGNVYVADTDSGTIRKITPAGAVTTLAGLAGVQGSVDGTGNLARFNQPRGAATDSSGNVYVVDQFNNAIRKITPSGAVTTVGGLPGAPGGADGTGSAARFAFPLGIATDSSGRVFVADTNNHKIRVGIASLPDVATIDLSTGSTGITRQFDTSPQTATSWQWSVIRRPVDSVAMLSSTIVRNPTFTPDVPGLFQFRLIASAAAGASIATVDLSVTAAGVAGDVNGDSRVSVADVFYLINFLFVGGAAPIGPGDANGDGRLSVADVFYLINFLFVGGPAPL